MRDRGQRLRRFRFDRSGTSTAAVCTLPSSATDTDAIAGRQSVKPQYRAATELHADNAFNTEHNDFDTRHDAFNVE
jgi:hypothetical protein